MNVPDHRRIVEQVFGGGGYTLSTKAGAGLFTEAVVVALHRVDANWGHLRKPEGRTHVTDAQGNRHAVDVVLYKATGQIVDIITNAGEPEAGLSWGPGREFEYGEGDWYAPVGVATPDPGPLTPIPTQPPVTGTPPAAGDLSGLITLLAYQYEQQSNLLNEILLTVQLQTGSDEANERRYKDLVAHLESLHEMVKDLPVKFEARLFGQTITLTGKPR